MIGFMAYYLCLKRTIAKKKCEEEKREEEKCVVSDNLYLIQMLFMFSALFLGNWRYWIRDFNTDTAWVTISIANLTPLICYLLAGLPIGHCIFMGITFLVANCFNDYDNISMLLAEVGVSSIIT